MVLVTDWSIANLSQRLVDLVSFSRPLLYRQADAHSAPRQSIKNGTNSPWTHSRLLSESKRMAGKKRKSNRFGEAVREARTANGLTQEELASRSGLDRSYIGGVERGERNPTLSVIERIAEGIGIALPELFSYSAKGPRA